MNNYNPPCCTSNRNSSAYANNAAHPAAKPSGDTSCACRKSAFPMNTALAMAYVPFQQSTEVYSCERALARGTIFPCLDKPFLMGCCK